MIDRRTRVPANETALPQVDGRAGITPLQRRVAVRGCPVVGGGLGASGVVWIQEPFRPWGSCQPQLRDRLAARTLHLLECMPELLGGGRPIRRVLCHGEHEEVGKTGRHVDQARNGSLRGPPHQRQLMHAGLAGEGRHPGNEGVERRREALQVRADLGQVPTEHLGGHVVDREGRASRGGSWITGDGGDPEVAQFGLTERTDQQVLGLDVAMERPPLMRRPQGRRRPRCR